MSDSALSQPEVGAEGEQNGSEEGGERHAPGDDSNGADPVNATALETRAGAGGHQPPEVASISSAVQDRPESTGATSQQQLIDADMSGAPLESYAFSHEPGEASPIAHADGGGDGEVQRQIDQEQAEHQLGAATAGGPESPNGFGIEDDAGHYSIRDGEEKFDGGGHIGRGKGDNQMYPIDSEAPPGRYSRSNVSNDGGHGNSDGIEGTKSFGERRQEVDDDSGSRSRRMFDGSRVAEPDDIQVVDAGEGADLIAGVDDLPIFANDQSKALNDEIKVRQGRTVEKRGGFNTKVTGGPPHIVYPLYVSIIQTG